MATPRAAHPRHRPAPVPEGSLDVVRNAGRPVTPGLNVLCDDAERNPATGISLALAVVEPGATVALETRGLETAVIPISGAGEVEVDGARRAFDRHDWVTERPLVGHGPAGTRLVLHGGARRAEVAVIQTPNADRFPSRLIPPEQVPDERRGEGFAGDTALRIVRTAFDHSNAPPESKLVLGEVINFPGRWSSYPGHIHPQPEWYLYKFQKDGGYGQAQNGDRVHYVYENDVLRIHPDHVHAQVSAPGFFMYYVWAVRHLERNPYTGFTYLDQRHVDVFFGEK